MRKEVIENIPADQVRTVIGDAVADGAEKIECFRQNNGNWIVISWFN